MGTVGRVILQDGVFKLPNEEIVDHEQQPQFLPRIVWPTRQDAAHSQARTALNVNVNWADRNEVLELYEEVQEIYPNLDPMPPFRAGSTSYDECPWLTHLAITHGLFHRTLQNGKSLNINEMTALVRMITYGIFDSTTFFEPWGVTGVPDKTGARVNPNTFEEMWSPIWCMNWKTGRFGQDIINQGTEWVKERLWSRRWVIVPIVYGGLQWGMTIFDRLEGQLYIFDCGDDKLKTERVKSAIQFWVTFLNMIGQPSHFRYFVPNVTKQLHYNDSALLCISWLMEVLRNQVGRPMSSSDEGVDQVNFEFPDLPVPADVAESFTSSLYLRDWVPEGCATGKSRLMAVRRVLRVMLANELGLRDHDVMTKQYQNQTRLGPPILPSAFKLLTEAGEDLYNANGRMAKSKYFTGHGGPQFALPMRRPKLPYDPDALRCHGIDKLPGDTHRARIRPIELTCRSQAPYDWPETFSFSSKQPVSDPAPELDLTVDSVWDVSEPGSGGSKVFNVKLTNLAVADMYKDVEKNFRVRVDQMRVRRLAADADDLFLEFTLSVGVEGGVQKSVDVSTPLPRIPGPNESVTPSTERLSPL